MTSLVIVKAIKALSVLYLSTFVCLGLLIFLEDFYWFGGLEKLGCAYWAELDNKDTNSAFLLAW